MVFQNQWYLFYKTSNRFTKFFLELELFICSLGKPDCSLGGEKEKKVNGCKQTNLVFQNQWYLFYKTSNRFTKFFSELELFICSLGKPDCSLGGEKEKKVNGCKQTNLVFQNQWYLFYKTSNRFTIFFSELELFIRDKKKSLTHV